MTTDSYKTKQQAQIVRVSLHPPLPASARVGLVALVLALGAVLVTLVARAAYSTPFQDELHYGPLYAALAKGAYPSAHELLAAHNGHPYLIVKVLITLTLLWELPWVWLMYAQVAVLAATALVVCLRPAPQQSVLALCTCCFVLLSPRQWENLYWAMQIAFPLFLLLTLIAFSAVDRYARSGGRIWAVAALASALLASVSNGAGIFSVVLATVALAFVRSDRTIRLASTLCLIVATVLFAYSQSIAPRSGLGGQSIDLIQAGEHAARMLGHQFLDGTRNSVLPLALGLAAGVITAFVFVRSVQSWRESLFELLCISLSGMLVAGVTFSRLSAGIIQPDAPRYLPLIAPLTIGTLLLLARYGYRNALFAVCFVIAVGYAIGLRSEWHAAPYRRANLSESHQMLCRTGQVHPINNMAGFSLKGTALSDVRALFCKEVIVTARQLDHGNIAATSATGFYREERHTWIGTNLSVGVPANLPRGARVEIHGWLPDLQAYQDGEFSVEVFADGVLLTEQRVTQVGGFSVETQLPTGASLLEVRGPARKKPPGEQRNLSWVLVSVTFN